MKNPEFTTQERQEKLGSSIRDARTARQLDQNTLAEQADISVRFLRNMETGEGSSLSSLIEVARALDKEGWLLSFSEGPLRTAHQHGTLEPFQGKHRASEAYEL